MPSTSPSNVTVTSEATSIMLVWNRFAVNVDSYLINYSFIVTDCPEVNGENVESVCGLSRGHTLTDLKENSHFNISITAINTVENNQTAHIMTTTHTAGRFPCSDGIHTLLINSLYSLAPSSGPADLQVSSISPTRITITWSPVPCVDRNGEVTGYTVRYAPTSYPDELRSDVVVGNSNMIFTANNLIPRTNYTLAVQAYHSLNSSTSLSGPFTSISGITAISTGIVQ